VVGQTGSPSTYDYTDASWYIDKSPFSHGYDNLGNPIYWYIKDTDIVSRLFSVTTAAREALAIRRADYKSDMLIHLTPPNSREVACEASIGTIKSRDWGKNAPDGSRENGVTLGREFLPHFQ